METIITLRQGQSDATVVVTREQEGARIGATPPLTLKVPLILLPDILTQATLMPDQDPGTRTPTGNLLGKIMTPSEWRVNLFPDNPYALFESAAGGNGTTIAVRGYEAHTRTLMWRRDGTGGSGKELLFRLPKTVWVTLWKSKRLAQAWIFTIAEPNPWPHNINDENRILHPWGAGNVFEDGRVCWGSAPSVAFGTDGVNAINQNFYGSLFNDHTSRINLAEEYRYQGDAVAMNQHHFSLQGMWKQTTAGVTKGDKIGQVLHDTHYTRSLLQVLSAAAGM